LRSCGSAVQDRRSPSRGLIGSFEMGRTIPLPRPRFKGHVSLEEAISKRRSTRKFSERNIMKDHLSQLLWACQGITHGYYRAVPSAGATYPLEVHIVAGEGGVEALDAGVYGYASLDHSIALHLLGDLRRDLCSACLGQDFIMRAPVSLVISSDYSRTTSSYGERGVRYVHMEAGHLGQSVALQGEALGFGSVMVGAFRDEVVSRVLNLAAGLKPLYVVPVGYPRG
jgi:SagB-type dehydrogenase family enzyme